MSMKGFSSWRHTMYRHAAATCTSAKLPDSIGQYQSKVRSSDTTSDAHQMVGQIAGNICHKADCTSSLLAVNSNSPVAHLVGAAAAGEVALQRQAVQPVGRLRGVLPRPDVELADQQPDLGAAACQALLVRIELQRWALMFPSQCSVANCVRPSMHLCPLTMRAVAIGDAATRLL